MKNGTAQLDELFDVIKSYRRNWLTAGKEPRREHLSRRIATPESTTSKRRATSPVERCETVRSRNEKDGEWQNVMPKRKKKPHADVGNVKEVPKQAEIRPQRMNTATNLKKNNRIKRQSEAVIIKPR